MILMYIFRVFRYGIHPSTRRDPEFLHQGETERMSKSTPKKDQPFRRAWQWLREQFSQEVSEDSALCEFDCRKLQCQMGEWESCERRLSRAAGELMPYPKKSSPPQF